MRTSIGSEKDNSARLSVAEFKQRLIEDDIMDATSFHQSVHERSDDQTHFLLFSFKRLDESLGSWTLLCTILMASLFTVANAVIVQILQEKMLINVGEILFFRSLIIVLVMVFQTRNTPALDLNLGEDRQVVIIGSVTLSVANITFLLALTNISIAAAFACIVMIHPVSLVVEKNWRFPFSTKDYQTLTLCFLGVIMLLFPWHGHHFVGIALGLITLVLSYSYEMNSKSLKQPMNLIKMVYLSNVLLFFLSMPILVALRPTWLHLASFGLIALMALFYLLSLELVHRVSTAFKDEFVHVLFFLHVFLGFLADYGFGMKDTNLVTLLGAVFVLTGSYLGNTSSILAKFWSVVRYGNPQPPIMLSQV